MKKVLIGLLVLIAWSGVFLTATTVTQAVLELPWIGQMPIHETLGMLSDPGIPSHPVIARTQEAFSGVYGPLWYEDFVHSDARYMLNKLHDSLLSSMLPATISIGKIIISNNQVSVQIEAKNQEAITHLAAVWVQDTKNRWKIVTLSEY